MTPPRKALITGVTGQDGSYLADLLLRKGYEVHAIVRRASTFNRSRIEHLLRDEEARLSLRLYYGDLADSSQISNMIRTIQPDELYHLGAQSQVRVSFDMPEYTGDVTGLGTTRILESVRQGELATRIYQASSSEMFGNTLSPQNEESPFHPRSPYGVSKLYSYWMARNYRDGYGLWCSNGILFNHESPRRGPTFVTRKVAAGVVSILAKHQDVLHLGNLDSKRDWGYAPEYVEAMWRMMQLRKPNDYVIGTGETHSVREFVDEAFSYVGLRVEDHIQIDKRYFRPTEIDELCADSAKARNDFGWEPRIKYKDLVKILIDAESRALGLKPIGEGDAILAKTFPNMWWRDERHLSFEGRDSIY